MSGEPTQFKQEGAGLFNPPTDQAADRPAPIIEQHCPACATRAPHVPWRVQTMKMPHPMDGTVVLAFPGNGPWCIPCSERLVQAIALNMEPRMREKVGRIETTVVTDLRNQVQHWKALYNELKAQRDEGAGDADHS